jgi:MFS family permease
MRYTGSIIVFDSLYAHGITMPMLLSPFSIANVRLFILFRIFFNSRFYYPVFTILFLDYGLSIQQFSLLNTVWAITIVFAEVPSGALADILGRKQLLVATSLLMVAEMMVIGFVPLGNSNLIFWAFFINRILSGLAEAMASGADEAIAYDSLAARGNPGDWPRILSVQMRLLSLATIISMMIGALVYDPAMVNRLLAWMGSNLHVTQQTTMRYPIYLTLLLSFGACFVSLQMKEPKPAHLERTSGTLLQTLKDTTRMTIEAASWILATPFALAVILLGMAYDHILRMVVTLTSQYFRLIGLPEASFGLIGAALSVIGVVSPKIAEKMVVVFSPAQNVLWLAGLTSLALLGLTGFFPYFGLLPVALTFFLMMLVSFFSSHYLNRITPSHQRATVLSFKGMGFNLAYGLIGLLFALLVQQLRTQGAAVKPLESPGLSLADQAFKGAICWLPAYSLIVLGAVILFCLYRLGGSAQSRQKG